MRIGLIAPPWIPVPPPAYGGTEVVIDNLARGLQRRGHDVRLFSVASSTCPVPLRYLYPDAVEPMNDGLHEAAHALAAYDALRDVDAISDHTALGALVVAAQGERRPPVVITTHGPFTAEARRVLDPVNGAVSLVAISHSQARQAAPLRIEAVIHHGIDLDTYRPADGGTGGRSGDGYLVFVGRMSPDKGVHRAVRIARRAGRRLAIVTKMRDPAEREYYEQVVRPLLPPDAEPPVELPLPERLALVQGADALLDPIRWPEPFGLVMAEALACGVPVLAFPHGAAPEIVRSGENGFLCADDDEMVAAIARVGEIDRARCRADAEERFSLDRMAADYERVLERAARQAARPAPAAVPHPVHQPALAHHRVRTVPAAPVAAGPMSLRAWDQRTWVGDGPGPSVDPVDNAVGTAARTAAESMKEPAEDGRNVPNNGSGPGDPGTGAQRYR